MRFMSFNYEGVERFGYVRNDRVFDLAGSDAEITDLKSLISSDAISNVTMDDLLPSFALSEIQYLPVIPNPGKILCIGLNYETHRKETGREKTAHPAVFTRFADTQIGHENNAWLPRISDKLDYEGELAVIIGRGGRYIERDAALAHIAGYACYNDITVRDWQRHTIQFTPGKNFPRSGGFGPFLVTPDEIGDPTNLDLTTRLNGEVMQHATTSSLIFDIPALIEYISTFTPLSPGDVIATGTPGGVGFKRDPLVFMRPGDVVEVEVSGVGLLRNKIVEEPN